LGIPRDAESDAFSTELGVIASLWHDLPVDIRRDVFRLILKDADDGESLPVFADEGVSK
jgi:hypothetical protein